MPLLVADEYSQLPRPDRVLPSRPARRRPQSPSTITPPRDRLSCLPPRSCGLGAVRRGTPPADDCDSRGCRGPPRKDGAGGPKRFFCDGSAFVERMVKEISTRLAPPERRLARSSAKRAEACRSNQRGRCIRASDQADAAQLAERPAQPPGGRRKNLVKLEKTRMAAPVTWF